MSTTLLQLRTKTRRYLNETTANRWTDAEITAYENEAIVWLQGMIERSNSDWFLRVETFTAAAEATGAAFPSDVWGNKIRGLWCYPGITVASGQGYRVGPGQLEWIMQNMNYSATQPECYAMHAGYVRWAPMLSDTSCFRYIYAKKETPLVSDNDPMDRIMDQHADLVAMYAAKIAYEKVGANTVFLENRIDRGLLQMRSDVRGSDPITIPQVDIDG